MSKEGLSCWISESDHVNFKAWVDFYVQFIIFKICHCLIPFHYRIAALLSAAEANSF